MKKLMLLLLMAFAFASASELGKKLTAEGWCFMPPRPKSAQAAYGNYDKRTTWFYGYWVNSAEQECSLETPRLIPKHGIYVGDGRDCESAAYTWRNGGYMPNSKIEQECLCKTAEN
jgi:hypothetical protein